VSLLTAMRTGRCPVRSVALVINVLLCLLWLQVTAAQAATVQVSATVETDPVPNSGDAADDAAIWIHPTDPSLSTVIGTDKTTGGGLIVYDLSGRRLYFYADGRLNNVDVRYNFVLGDTAVALVGATNRVLKRIDFYKVNPADRSLTKAGSVPTSSAITTPRGFALYHSPTSGKYYAFVTDSGKTDQYELSGASGSVTGTLVRQFALSNPTEGLVADDELGRLYVAEEDIGGIWRYGAEPGDGRTGVKVDSTTELGGNIVQDVKGLALYYGSNGTGYLLAASQGSDSFHVYNRGDNAHVGAFKIVAGNGIDEVTGEDGIDVTSFGLGPRFPQGFFISQDHANGGGGNQNFKLVPWQSIATAFSPALLVDTSLDPRLVGGGGTPTAPDTSIDSGPSGVVNDTNATFTFSSTDASATFQCRLDGVPFAACRSPQQYAGLAESSHTFDVRAVNSAGTADPTPASRTWTVDLTPPQVTAVAPADGASDVSVGTDVRATFAEAMDAATLNTTTFTLARADDGSPVTASVSYDAGTRTAILRPSSPLPAGAPYRAKVSTGAKDVGGNALAADKVWSFATSTQPPPTGVRRESTSTAVNGTATGTVRIATPAGTAPGDVLVACLALNGGTLAGTGVPAGWSPVASVTGIANPHVFGYYKVAGPSEPTAYQWTLTSSVQNAGGIARYSGVDTARPIDGTARTATGAATTAGTVPGVTTATANAMLIGCMGINSSSTTIAISSPQGMGQAWDLGGKRHELADGPQAVAGPSGDKTWTFSASREWAGWLGALRAAG
jgi:myo-inositol-hexaphosphate 3-phosphohydrolase